MMRQFSLIFCCFFYFLNSYGQSAYLLSNTGIPSNFNTYDFIATPTELFAIGATFASSITPGIYKFTNNGSSWSPVTATGLQNHNYLYTAAIVAGSTYFMNASSNTGSYAIYSSSNGTNWTLSNSGIPSNFSTQDFIAVSSTSILAVGSAFNGTTFIPAIYQSGNGGSSWSIVNANGLQNHNYLYSASVLVGNKMLLNASNTSPSYAIYSSTNGTNWSLSNTGIPANFNTYDFIVNSATEVYAVGAYFTGATPTPGVYKSTDGGTTWTSYIVSGMTNHNYLYTASAKSGNTFFINASSNTGSYAIYQSTLPNPATSIAQTYSESLFFAGPNPCNDYLIFNTGLAGTELNLELIDLNNHVVAKTTIENTGYLSVAHLPEGVYFLRVQSDNKSSRKIVIMR